MADGPAPPEARTGTFAPSQRLTFAPTRLRLQRSGRPATQTTVQAVDTTAKGVLGLPADPGRVGWWMGGALAGEAFGGVVLAGHIDSAEKGLGFFALLLDVRAGDRVTLSDGRLSQLYVVTSRRDVGKSALAATGDVFSGRVPARLVLITCTGRFDASTRHYDRNLLVIATPVGRAVAG